MAIGTVKNFAKYVFHKIICRWLLFFGIDKLLRNRSSNRCLIVMYHGVSGKKNFSINGRHLPSDEFEKHLIYFTKYFDILSLKELCDKRLTNTGRYAVALTFDDGYLNNIQHAIPLLIKYKIPATFFVSTISLIEEEYLHPPDYIDIIRKTTPGAVDINGTLFHHRNGKLMNSNGSAYNYINSLSFKDFKNTLKTLKSRYPFKNILTAIDPDVYSVATGETVAGFLSEKLFNVGSHSHDHVNLNTLSKEELGHQLAISKKMLEDLTQSSVDLIAFPYGYFNNDVIECSTQHGYRYMFAGGSVTDEWKHRVFPRIGVLNMGGYAFNMLSINRGFRRFGF